MKCKIFIDEDLTSLENKLNEWFAKNPNIKIKHVAQSHSPLNMLYIPKTEHSSKDQKQDLLQEIKPYTVISIFYMN